MPLNNNSNTYNNNQSNSSSNLNNNNTRINSFNSVKPKSNRNSTDRQEKSQSKTEDENKECIELNSSICFQVYNLKQNLTKNMLINILKPYVASIDFKPISDASDIQPNDSIINEEHENVFIKFENVDKLRQAFKSFNLNETDILKEKAYSNQSNDHVSQLKETSETKSLFLLRSVTIC
jgi:hypothetical protein